MPEAPERRKLELPVGIEPISMAWKAMAWTTRLQGARRRPLPGLSQSIQQHRLSTVVSERS